MASLFDADVAGSASIHLCRFAMKFSGFLHHGWRDVIADEAAVLAFGAKQAHEVAEAAAKIDDGCVAACLQRMEKPPVTTFMRFNSIPVDALRRRAV